MRNKVFKSLFFFVLLAAFEQGIYAQTSCTGEKIFTEKRCAGDEISSEERELFRMVNDYRVQNNLPQVPMSDSLSLVANRHLLDLIVNVKSLSHGWSNCAYDFNNEKTWDCLFESPKRLNSGYSGKGYENLYRTKTGIVSAVSALDAWKKSDLHNALILNLKTFKDTDFDACGIAINGQYAALWFGSGAKTAGTSNKPSNASGSGITFEKAVSGFSNILLFDKSSANFVNEKWTAFSSDKTIALQLNGKKEDIVEAAISTKVEKNNQLSQKNKDIFTTFLSNVAAEWSGRENWLNTSLAKIQINPRTPQTITLGNKVFVLSSDERNNFLLSIKINKKPAALLL